MLVNLHFDKWSYFTGKKTVRKSCYNQKIWIFVIRQGLDKVYKFDKTILIKLKIKSISSQLTSK